MNVVKDCLAIAAPFVKNGTLGFMMPQALQEAHDRHDLFVAQNVEATILGWLAFRRWKRNPRKMTLYRVVVKEGYHNLGIGHRLITLVLQLAQWELRVATANCTQEMLPYYINKFGFTHEGPYKQGPRCLIKWSPIMNDTDNNTYQNDFTLDDVLEVGLDSVVPACCIHECEVEPDGHCSHGNPSILLEFGLI